MMRIFMAIAGLLPAIAFADVESNHLDPAAPVILWVTVIFFLALLGRFIAKISHQPSVLGELLMGVLVGNLCYFFGMPLAIILREGSAIFSIMTDVIAGMPLSQSVHQVIADGHYASQVMLAFSGPNGSDLLKVAYVVDMFSRYGILFLLFMVGLETSVEDLKHTGRESLQVAVLGMLAPIILGLLVSKLLMPHASFSADLFVAATLSATSIGITARVLKDMKKLRTREAKTILGAATIDDILGLILLAIVSSIVIQGALDMMMLVRVILLVVVFFIGSLWLGPYVLRQMVRLFKFLNVWEAKLFTSFIFVMGLSWLATVVQLASIIGAFVAGMIIHEGFFKSRDGQVHSDLSIRTLISPLEALLAPLFFMLIGIQVKLETFCNAQVLLIACGLIAAAVLGKLLSGLGANRRDDRLLVGIGMLPRGEVGLVFASIGRTIGVISDELFSAIVLMVIVTTFLAPPWLKMRFKKQEGVQHD
jgi:Kef-type K+ transport system membrane component KefB